MQIADRTKGDPAENTSGGIPFRILFAGGDGIANLVITTVIVASKIEIITAAVPNRLPILYALQINIRSLLKVVPVEVADTAANIGIGITVGGIAAIDVIRQRL